VGITPEALGTVTASKMMEEMNPDGEGRLSPRDFGWWLADEGTANVFPKSTAEGFACDSAGETPTVAENSQADASQGDRSVRKGLWGDQLEGQGHVAIRARKLLRLDCFNVNDLLEILAEVADMVSVAFTALANRWVSLFQPISTRVNARRVISSGNKFVQKGFFSG